MSEDTAVKQKGDFKSKRNIILIILIAIIIVFVGILNYFTSKNLYNVSFSIFSVSVYKANKQEISLTEKGFFEEKVSTRHHALGIYPSFFLIYRQISKIFHASRTFVDNRQQTCRQLLTGKYQQKNFGRKASKGK